MPKIIVITGAESTGKTSLARNLSKYFSAPYVEEYARGYITSLNRRYTFDDVLAIAQMQEVQMKVAKKLNQEYVFFDTWLIITQIWFDHVFGSVPAGFSEKIANAPIDLFLVCNTDLAWKPDPVRENGGSARELLHRRYIDTIERYNFNYSVISGENEARLMNAVKIIQHKIG